MAITNITIQAVASAQIGAKVKLEATGTQSVLKAHDYKWVVPRGRLDPRDGQAPEVTWDTTGADAGANEIKLEIFDKADATTVVDTKTDTIDLKKTPYGPGDTVPVRLRDGEGTEQQPFNVSLRRSAIVDTPDLPLWNIIRRSAGLLSFNNYLDFTNFVICGPDDAKPPRTVPSRLSDKWIAQRNAFRAVVPDATTGVADPFPTTRLPFTDVESYRVLKAATEAFMMITCGVDFDPESLLHLRLDVEEREERLGLARGDTLAALMRQYVVETTDPVDPAKTPGATITK